MAKDKDGVFKGFIEDIKDFFRVGFQGVWNDLANLIPNLITRALSTIDSWTWGNPEGEKLQMLDDLLSMGAITKDDYENFRKWIDSFKRGRNYAYWAITLAMWMTVAKVKSNIVMGGAMQDWNKLYEPNPASPEAIMRGMFIAPEKSQAIVDRMKASGLSDSDIDLMLLANYATYPMEVIRQAWLRGIIDDDLLYERMRELGFTDTRIKEIVATWPVIPSPSDLLYMVAKEAFEPDIIEYIGLDEEFPEGQVQWLEKQGVSREWALLYWYAHWDTPSVGQAYEMLHRGVITEYEMDIAFRNAEVPPFWRQKLKEIAYNVFTRVDTRRMHAMGVLSDEELIKAYKDQGYDQYRAEKMAEFTKLYNARAEKDITMSQIMRGYRSRAITEKQTLALLERIGYTPDRAEWLLALEDIKQTMDTQDDIIKNIQARYENNLIEKMDVTGRLNQLNLTAQEIQLLVDKWDINKYEDMKLMSKTDLGKLYITGVIKEDTYRSDMRRIGYNFRQVEDYLKYMKKEKKPI